MKNLMLMLFCLVSITLFSQELPDLKAYRHDIGFNTSILVNGIINSNQGPFDFMYKVQKSSNTAIRLGASIYGSVGTDFYSNSTNYQKRENWAFNISFGKEKQQQLSKRWIFHYGMDLRAYYSNYNTDSYSDANLYNTTNFETWGGGVAPFLGIRFQILEKLYVATEASLRIAYGREANSWTNYDSNNTVTSSNSDSFNNLKLYAQPAAGIFIFYRF
jgi:hypothetical protein